MSLTITLSTCSADADAFTGVHYVKAVDAIDELYFDLRIPLFRSQNMVRPYKTFVTMQSDNESFTGRVVSCEVSQTDNGILHVVCEGSQGYLKDSWVFPGSKDPADEEENVVDETTDSETNSIGDDPYHVWVNPGRGYHFGLHNTKAPNASKVFDLAYPQAGTTLTRILDALKNAHNGFVPVSLRISTILTNCGNLILQHDLSIGGQTVYEAMNTVAKEFGVEWQMIGSVVYVQKKFGTVKGTLKTGLNLNGFSKSEDAKDLYTAILPLGGVGYDEKRLSLSSKPCNAYAAGETSSGEIRGYLSPAIGSRARPYVKNEELVKLYGLRIKLVTYDDIVVNAPEEYKARRDELLSQALVDCEELAQQTISISASAFDFANTEIGGPGPELTVHDYYNVSDYITGTNMILRLVSKDINYDDILNPSLAFVLDDRKKTVEKVDMAKSIVTS